MIELSGVLYRSYKIGNTNWKSLLLKNMMVELIIDNKKELVIKENKLFSDIKTLNFNDGKPIKYDGGMIFSYFMEHTDEIYENLIDLEKIL